MPQIARGALKITNIYRGTTPITHIYKGSTLVWQRVSGGTVEVALPTAGWDFTTGTPSVDITVTRAGSAWQWNASQVLIASTADVQRLDYDPETGTILGLLVEPAATNLLLYGRTLNAGVTATAWTASNMTVADNVTGRDGVANKASTITATAAMATLKSAKTAASTTYTFSAWVKRKTGYGPVDVTIDNGTTWVEMTAHVLGGQWVRIGNHLQGYVPQAANPTVGFRLHESGDQLEVDLCQLEVGLEATSEIPTEGSTVSRAADVVRCVNIPLAGAGRGYDFTWPLAATVRGARWVRTLAFSNIVTNTSADVTVTYTTQEPGKPAYVQTRTTQALTT